MDLSELVPAEAYNRVEADRSAYGKVKYISSLKAKNGKMICTNLPADWINYIKESINNYYIKESYIVKEKPKPNPIIARFTLNGQPMAKTDSKVVGYNADGVMVIEANKEYNSYIIQLKKKQHLIIRGKEKILPIDTSVIIECKYFIKRTSNKRFNLADLLSTTLDVLVQLHILKSDKDNIVIGLGNSSICYTKDEPHTEIIIRRPTAERKQHEQSD